MIPRFLGRISSARPSCTSLNPEDILLYSVSGDLEFAGYSSVGFIKIVEIDDSAYICHQFHPNAHLSKYLERESFPS